MMALLVVIIGFGPMLIVSLFRFLRFIYKDRQ